MAHIGSVSRMNDSGHFSLILGIAIPHNAIFSVNGDWLPYSRHNENFWAFTGPRIDFSLILLINIKHDYTQEFYRSYHLLSANVRGPISFAMSDTVAVWTAPLLSNHHILPHGKTTVYLFTKMLGLECIHIQNIYGSCLWHDFVHSLGRCIA